MNRQLRFLILTAGIATSFTGLSCTAMTRLMKPERCSARLGSTAGIHHEVHIAVEYVEEAY
jgi:hypothetical protein